MLCKTIYVIKRIYNKSSERNISNSTQETVRIAFNLFLKLVFTTVFIFKIINQ